MSLASRARSQREPRFSSTLHPNAGDCDGLAASPATRAASKAHSPFERERAWVSNRPYGLAAAWDTFGGCDNDNSTKNLLLNGGAEFRQTKSEGHGDRLYGFDNRVELARDPLEDTRRNRPQANRARRQRAAGLPQCAGISLETSLPNECPYRAADGKDSTTLSSTRLSMARALLRH